MVPAGRAATAAAPDTSNGAPPALPLDAPNVVVIGPDLVSSGQPSAQALQSLAAHGFQAVIYLAPSTVPSAVSDEAQRLAAQGITFIHLPIEFGAPTAAHVERFNAAMASLRGRQVLVHCEINMRASSMVFLYRVTQRQEPPALAYEAVARVWSPRGVWRRLIVDQLARYQLAFEPY